MNASRIRKLRYWTIGLAAVAAVASTAHAWPWARPPFKSDVTVPETDRQPKVQVALLLDTSNSMDGLIFQARTQLWTIVNELAKAKRGGVRPVIEVALYEYGNNSLASGEGYVRQVVGFTSDLDLVSERLWQLTTNGGSEFCGHVIESSIKELKWDEDSRAYRAIFIAGNEPFTQGPTDYRTAVARAAGKGVVVNTIHCGSREDGVSGMWADGAKRGEGEFMWIDQNIRRHVRRCPQDDEISRLSSELNGTYLPYGPGGAVGAERQREQDAVAAANSEVGAAADRAAAKAGGAYYNASWDLVDAVRDGKIDPDKLDEEQLPPALRAVPAGQRSAFVQRQLARRQEIAAQIQRLHQERARYLAEHAEEPATGEGESLDAAAIKAVRSQMEALGYSRE
jgi:hypothetical protein